MITSQVVMLSIVSVLSLLLIVATYFAIKFALLIIRTQDAIEDSLDVLDITYANISKILDRPLFHDSPEIRNVLSEIETSRNSILNVASVLTKIDVSEESQDKDI